MYSVKVSLALLSLTTIIRINEGKLTAIRGGIAANAGQYSFSVAVKGSGFHHCSGSIIGEKHVATAACCLFDDPRRQARPISPLQVIAGTNNYDDPEAPIIQVDVEKFFVPRIYFEKDEKSAQKTARNGSIAVLKLKQSLDLGKTKLLSKLDLPMADSTHETGIATVTGFGWDWSNYEHDPLLQTSDSIGNPSCQLRAAKTYLMDPKHCQNHLKTYTDRHLCARVEQRMIHVPEGTCYGDQGGPLVYEENTLIGILIAGSNEFCDESKSPGIYTKVASYRSFIDKSMEDVEDPEIVSFVMSTYTDPNNDLSL